jgi:5'(3')-deoxyribonucleotidase
MDGLKLKPYPKVKFIHTDFKNADNFFGKTAYYDPNNNEVVLYTLGRHPKDILRSYAHELIHVHQNHEDRLENINTDNVNEDEYLEQIEREAYEEGNIAFRSWTNKDPFGLAEAIFEIAEDEEYYIYLDMDGVVADFDKRFEDLSGMMPQAYVDKNGLNAFWDLIDEKHKVAFWRGIELMPGAQKLVKFVEQYPFEMLTAPSIKKQSIIGKGLWVKDKIGTLYSTKPKVTYRSAKQKHTVKPNLTKFDILIDDKGSTIDNWNAAGGTGIFYQNADQVINDLKKLGL